MNYPLSVILAVMAEIGVKVSITAPAVDFKGADGVTFIRRTWRMDLRNYELDKESVRILCEGVAQETGLPADKILELVNERAGK